MSDDAVTIEGQVDPDLDTASSPRVKVLLRLDADVAAAIRAWAAEEDRTVSAQIRRALRGSVPEQYFGRA